MNIVISKSYWLIGASELALLVAPLATFAQTVPPASTDQATPQLEEIVVQGYRKSLETAAAIKENADQIVDAIVAEDIGKLPDSTGAESLARVPGVSVERLNGEAANIRVRGLPDLTTTYNGREIFTAEGRSVALQDFPSGTISRFDVYKTGSANLIEGGIAGAIDVRSRKPFDFKGARAAGGVTGLGWRQSDKLGLDANMLLSNRWNTGIGEIGVLLEGSYTDNNFVDSYRTNNPTIQLRPASSTYPGGRYPAVVTFEYPTSMRQRPSASTAIQWRPTETLEVYADFLFQGFRGRGESRALQVQAGTAATISDVTYCDGSTTLICQMTATGGNPVSAYQVGQWSGTDTYQSGIGFKWNVGEAKVTGDVAWTDSTFTSTNFQMNTQTNVIPTRIFNFDDSSGGGGGNAQVLGVDLMDPASWRMTGYTENGSQAHGESYQGRLDADIPIALSIFDSLQAGIRYSDRDSETESYPATNYVAPATTAAQRDALQFTALPLDYAYVHSAFAGDSSNHPTTWVSPTRRSVIENEDLIRALTGRPTGFPTRVPQYSANEKSEAAYLQVHYELDAGSLPLDGQIGVRVVRTSDEVDGVLTVGTTTPTPYSRDNEYTDVLPNFSVRARITPELQARLAFTKTRTRPSFGQLNPTLTVNGTATCSNPADTTTCYRTANGGNPELEPIESTNYDASLEYYFSRSGSATIQLFRRDVDGFINNTTRFIDDPQLGRLNINSPENGQSGRIDGVEVGYRTFLEIQSLPAWTRNLGVLANYTYLDHGSELSPAAAATLPGRQPITNTSTHLANASVFYENQTFSLRASYNYRSHYLTYSAVTDPAVTGTQPTLPTKEEGRGTLDISGGYNLTEQLSVNFNVANLLGNPARNSRIFNTQGDSYPWQVRYLETVYRLGIRFRY
ncbi:TonB-dependent receptor [Steroidobacter flavus]|uniref:TonB-dependent receptor n=1 Tax=Steroidobacter flavus TaxID=1842136 RepID=A0ABV8SZH4_9GAMM